MTYRYWDLGSSSCANIDGNRLEVYSGHSSMSFQHVIPACHSMPTYLHEGVAAGAADGWARMTRRPAAVILHLGPGEALFNSKFEKHFFRKR